MPTFTLHPFEEIVADQTRLASKIQRTDYLESGALPVVDQGQEFIAGYTNASDAAFSGSLPVVIFGDHTRALKYVDFPFAAGADGVKVLVPRDGLEARFLYYYLRSIKLPNDGYSRHFKHLRNLSVPVPTISEQRRIVDLLSRAENIVRMRREAEAKAKDIIPALFLDMFGDPGTNPYKHPLVSLRDLVDESRPITYGILKPGPDQPDGIPYVRVVDIKDGRILTSQLRRTSSEIEVGYKRSRLKGGDLLMSIRGHVGRMAIVPDEIAGANITQDSARIAPRAGVEVAFLVGYLEAQATQFEMKRLTKGVAVRGINLGDLKALQVPVPTPNAQKDFTMRFNKAREILSMQSRATEAAAGAFESLLAGVFGEAA